MLHTLSLPLGPSEDCTHWLCVWQAPDRSQALGWLSWEQSSPEKPQEAGLSMTGHKVFKLHANLDSIFFFKINLFGCVGSQLQHIMGSLLYLDAIFFGK